MSFPASGERGGDGGNGGKSIRMTLSQGFSAGQDSQSLIQFDQIPFNDGFSSYTDGVIEMPLGS